MPKKTIIGMLVDVSGSMKDKFQSNAQIEDSDITRIQSVIKTMLDIFKKEVTNDNDTNVFSIAFGLMRNNENETDVCDLLGLLKFAVNLKNIMNIPNGKTNLNNFLKTKDVLYAESFVNEYLTSDECAFIYALSRIPGNESKIDEIIESLPAVCKNRALNGVNNNIVPVASLMGGAAASVGLLLVPVVGPGLAALSVGATFVANRYAERQKRELEARRTKEVAKKAEKDFITTEIKKIENPNTSNISTAISVLESAFKAEADNEPLNLNKKKLDMIIDHIESYIYGWTLMCKALKLSLPLFISSYNEKILFFITDGQSTDGNPASYAQNLKNHNVTVIVCLLTSISTANPKQLYFNVQGHWPDWKKNMFQLSSDIDNAHPKMSILLERGWTLALEGHSKLFFQANNPEIVSEIGEIVSAKKNDVLLNIITRASLEKFINLDILMGEQEITAPDQDGGTCYANATAYVIYLALKRIYKREGKPVVFEDLREIIIAEYGKDGANTARVLQKYCESHDLQSAEVDERGAKIAISKRRAIVATFHLSEKQWNDFSRFYRTNKTGVLKTSDLRQPNNDKLFGHAVILVKVTPNYLLFMNSWGIEFADNGFFKVENAAVLPLRFYDVFWTEGNLKAGEKAAYEEFKNSGVSLIDEIPESIKLLPYTCPKCNQASPSKMFVGNFQEAICPICRQSFIPSLLNFAIVN